MPQHNASVGLVVYKMLLFINYLEHNQMSKKSNAVRQASADIGPNETTQVVDQETATEALATAGTNAATTVAGAVKAELRAAGEELLGHDSKMAKEAKAPLPSIDPLAGMNDLKVMIADVWNKAIANVPEIEKVTRKLEALKGELTTGFITLAKGCLKHTFSAELPLGDTHRASQIFSAVCLFQETEAKKREKDATGENVPLNELIPGWASAKSRIKGALDAGLNICDTIVMVDGKGKRTEVDRYMTGASVAEAVKAIKVAKGPKGNTTTAKSKVAGDSNVTDAIGAAGVSVTDKLLNEVRALSKHVQASSTLGAILQDEIAALLVDVNAEIGEMIAKAQQHVDLMRSGTKAA
jgi:hypothetical protein